MKSWGSEEVDICIVGSGAGGGPMAFELSRAGASVVVLEKGPWYTEKDFTHDEIASSRRDMWKPFASEEAHLLKTPSHPKARKISEGFIANCVGGGTVHMSGFFYRLHPEDFRMKSRYGKIDGARLADWPITYDDLAPWYDKVEQEVGLSGKAGENPFEPKRSSDYPMPPLLANHLAQLVDRGCKALGLHPFQTPRGICSEPFKGRGACVYCKFCGSYGCETGAKSSTLAALIPRAVETDLCEVRPKCMAFEITVDRKGRARSVKYYDEKGEVREQRAKIICVSCTALESARLLLNSKSKPHPKGLANGSGLVGKNLTFSTLGKAWGEWELGTLPEHLRAVHHSEFLQRSVQDYYFLPERKGHYDKGGTLNFLLPHRNPIFTAERISKRTNPQLWGVELQRALARHHRDVRELEFEVFGEWLPNDGTYVSVDGELKDRWGIPSATVHVDPHPEAVHNTQLLVQKGLEVFRKGGAGRTGIESNAGITWVLQHGTTRFGKDPAHSVLDPSCRAHEVENLYVVDGSFMPSSGGVPTTLTIMANSFRVADIVSKRLKK